MDDGSTVRVPQARKPRICILSQSKIADDPRVRRQGDAFHRAGWDVIGIGLAGARSHPPAWPIRDGSAGDASLGSDAPLASLAAAARAFRRCFLGLRLLLVRLVPAEAFRIFWAGRPARQLHGLARDVSADAWLANDWSSLPLAERLVRERGGIYGYDTHELAVEEYAEKWRWRLFYRPFVRVLEARLIAGAAVVSAVSPGIAEHLAEFYRLPAPPVAVRNVPEFVSIARRTTGSRVRVLYHGILAPGRGLEAAIDSVGSWRSEFDLTLRGPGEPAYLAALQTRIERRDLARRITLAPPVPMIDLVTEAAAFDVGFFALPAYTRHNLFALPNKFFEYVMAGLALCISDLPEMTRLLRRYDMGVSIAAVTPEAIAAAINALDRASIDRYRANALVAARELCWERESERLLSAYRQALDRLFPAQEPAAP